MMNKCPTKLAILFLWLSINAYGAFDYPAYSPPSAAVLNSAIAGGIGYDGAVMNPGLSAGITDLYASLSYTNFYNMTELQLSNGMVLFPYKEIGLGVIIQDFGNSRYREDRIKVLAAKHFNNNSFAVGIALSGYQVSIDGYGSKQALGIDVGFVYSLSSLLTFGGVIENVNQPSMAGRKEELPQVFRLGATFHPDEDLTAFIGIEKDSWYNPSYALGIAYQLYHTLTIYSGYSSLSAQPSFGLQLRIRRADFRYAVQYHSELGTTHFWGIAFHA